MSCDDYCVGFSDLFDGGSDRTKMELGPAYDDWKSGKVEIRKVYRPTKPLPPTIVPECCYDNTFDPEDFRFDFHMTMLGVWAFISVSVLIALWFKRKSQPLKFRSFNIMAILWLNMNLGMLYAVFSGSAGLTTQCDVQLLFQQIIVPIQLYYYTVKSGQLYFLYRWHYAKREENHRLATWFYRHKWVLSDWVFYGGVLFFVMTGLISYSVTITEVDLYDTEYRNGYSTARGTWWQIPEKYQAPTNGAPAPLCSCVGCFQEIVTTGAGDMCTACSVAYNTYCLPDAECFAACSPQKLAAGEFSTSCRNYMEKLLVSGECGFPSERMDESSVVYCWAAFRPGLFAYGIMYTCMAIINLCIAASVFRMDDQLFMRFDTIACFFVECPAIILIVLGLTFSEVNDAFFDASPGYPFVIALLYVVILWSTLVSFIIPIGLAYYYDYCKAKDLEDKANETAAETTVSSVHEFFKVVDDTARAGKPVLFEAELIFAITNDQAGQHYVQFAWKEFTVENIKFLQAVGMLMSSIDELDLSELAGLARSIFHTYIEVGSPLEVNISEVLRKQAALSITGNSEPHLHKIDRDTTASDLGTDAPTLFSSKKMSTRAKSPDGVELVAQDGAHAEEKTKDVQPDDGGKPLLNRSSLGGFLQRISAGGRDSVAEDHPAPLRIYDGTVKTQMLQSPEELLHWFAPVVREIKQIILRDSWPRFRKSAFYAEFKELYDTHLEYENVMKDIVVEPPRRSLSFSSTHTPSHKNSTVDDAGNKDSLSSNP